MIFNRNKSKKNPISKSYIVIYAFLLSIFIFSAYKLFDYYYNNYKSEQLVENLTKEKEDTNQITDDMLAPSKTEIIATASPLLPSDPALQPGGTDTKLELDINNILTPYKELYKENKDMAGWITIPNTAINYPVMYRKDDNETYLHTDFKGNKGSRSGCIFMDGRSHFFEENVSSNLILYGHNMRAGTMFHDIMKYEKETYYLAHPVIQFDFIYQTGTYDILAAFPYDIETSENSSEFKYYNYFHVTNEQEFNSYLKGIQSLSLYDTGISASWGDELITLSTCAEYSLDTSKRFVLVARKRQ